MSRRQELDPSILEAAKKFDAHRFAEAVQGDFVDFPDHRINRKRIVHPIWHLVLVILCGFFCGCNTVEEIAEYAVWQQQWFEELLGRPYPPPSYGTLRWFLVKVKPEALKQYLRKWVVKLPEQLRDQLLALDGKRLKSANFLGGITHVVELFAAEDRLVVAAEKVPDKTVEKSCLPSILKQVDVKGSIISGDAHFSVPSAAKQIIDHGADYLLAIKGNQPNLQAELENFFSQAHAIFWEGVPCTTHTSIEKGHGRIETREVRVVKDLDWLPQKGFWDGLSAIIEVKSYREHISSGKIESDTRLYISSRDADASEFAKWIRSHWSIENNCHWQLDVIFREDDIQMDSGYSAENLGIFRRLAMNFVAMGDPKRGLSSARRAATFKNGYLKGILAKIFCRNC